MLGAVISVSGVFYLAVYWACLAMGVAAFVDAIRRRPDAFVAADRQTKVIWLGILGGSIAAQIMFPAIGGGALSILGLAGIVASIVYLVDVRRRLIDVSSGPRW
jgi:hypothetical protein